MFRITFLSLLLSFGISNHSFAQEYGTDKGIILVKGSSNLKIDFSEGTPFNFNLGAGYFLIPNLAAGADILYSHFDGEGYLNVRPFGRYYFMEKFFAGAGVSSYDDADDEKKWFLDIEGGYVYFLNDYIAIEPSLNIPFRKEAKPSLSVSISFYY